jgi:hypothetical protein
VLDVVIAFNSLVMLYSIERWHTVAHSGEPYSHSERVTRWVVGVAKKNLFQIGHGRIAFSEHGGKSGRAMVKYPGYKKNNSRKNTLLYTVFTTVSFDRIITYMQYYYVMCQKGSLVHRCYVQLDPESADILHDSLQQRHDLVQVCDVKQSEVEPDILIAPAP